MPFHYRNSSFSQQGTPDVNPRVLNLTLIFYTFLLEEFNLREIEGTELKACCLMIHLGEGYEKRHEAVDFGFGGSNIHREQSAASTGIDRVKAG
jgi:hypothetical protein